MTIGLLNSLFSHGSRSSSSCNSNSGCGSSNSGCGSSNGGSSGSSWGGHSGGLLSGKGIWVGHRPTCSVVLRAALAVMVVAAALAVAVVVANCQV